MAFILYLSYGLHNALWKNKYPHNANEPFFVNFLSY